jgi:hypothetical protein
MTRIHDVHLWKCLNESPYSVQLTHADKEAGRAMILGWRWNRNGDPPSLHIFKIVEGKTCSVDGNMSVVTNVSHQCRILITEAAG